MYCFADYSKIVCAGLMLYYVRCDDEDLSRLYGKVSCMLIGRSLLSFITASC